MNEIGWNECMTQVGELLRLHITIEVTGQCSFLISARLVGMELVLCQYEYFYHMAAMNVIVINTVDKN